MRVLAGCTAESHGPSRARLMQQPTTMATSYQLHDHAGLRWLAPFGLVFAFMIGAAFYMMVYPHLTG
jgi:hypothetical protein